MKIIDIIIRKATVVNGVSIMCEIMMEDGSQIETVCPWRNTLGLWASDSDARDPAEIAAYLRSFAKAIEDATRSAAAA